MAVSPDPRFIAYEVFEHYFVNKMTGAPLAAGVVTFYKDNDRTVKKPVYQLTGSPPNYSFSALPNPCILSAVGTFQDGSGNNIVPYFFPYDDQGNIELYYITVTSAFPGLVPQFVRPAEPPNVADLIAADSESAENFIANGQFLVHNDIISATNPPITTVDGIDMQPIAQGGWFFKRTTGGLSTFANEFVRISSPVSGANDFPRYAFNFICADFDPSDEVRDLCYVWPGVYTFSGGNPPGTTDYTFMCENVSLDANIYTFQLILTQNFGTGGSPTAPIETVLGTVVTTDSFTYFVKNMIEFPADTGTLGDNDDDYVSLSLRGPSSSWRAQFKCFVLAIGNQQFTFYPPQPNDEVIAEAVFGALPTPASDGSDLYLKVQYTQTGMKFDYSEIGNIITKTIDTDFVNSISTKTNELLTDGNAYPTAGYSPLGIPYSRLQSEIWDATTNLPAFGTGITFVSSYIPSATPNIFRLTTNQAGPQTVTAEGAIPTTFTFDALYTGNGAYNFNTYISATAATFLAIAKVAGTATAATAGTSGLTVTEIYNSAALQQSFLVTAPGVPAAGTYFTFSNTTTAYYVWFTVNGAGADPAPGGTGILVPLLSTYTTIETIQLIREAVGGYQASNITTVAAASVAAGSYFTFFANSFKYAVWYKVANVGTEPSVSATNIEVPLTGLETDDEVATATQIAINMFMFATPNFKGVILRGWNTGADNIPGDLNPTQRFSLNDIFPANSLNTYQNQAILQHLHGYTAPLESSPAGTSAGGVVFEVWNQENGFTTDYGGSENIPFNYDVLYAIKY